MPDIIPPTLLSWTNNIGDTTKLTFEFDEAMKIGTGKIRLVLDATGDVLATYTVNSVNTANVFLGSPTGGIANSLVRLSIPTSSLTLDTLYNISFDIGTIKDVAGNNWDYGKTITGIPSTTADYGFLYTYTADYSSATATYPLSINLLSDVAAVKGTATTTGIANYSDTLYGIRNVKGGAGNDTLVGDTSANILEGNDGNDILNGKAGSGNDQLIGGDGSDTYLVDSTTEVLTETNATITTSETDTVQSTVSWTLGANFENLILYTVGATIPTTAINGTGNALDNNIIGNSGNNSISGGAGNDTLDGGLGNDISVGGTGNDVYFVDSASDVVTELNGTVEGVDQLLVMASYTTAFNTAYTGANAAQFAIKYPNVESYGYQILGTPNVDTLTGTANADQINGLASNDTITGNAGNDTLIGGAGSDSLTGGAGDDTFDLTGSDASTTETITDWGLGADVLTGTLVSGDILKVTFDNSSTTAFSAATAAAVYGMVSVTGGTSDDTMVGGANIDTLNGGAGFDMLTGGKGADSLTGGADRDSFLFNAGDSVLTIGGSSTSGTITGYDVITDFIPANGTTGSEKLNFLSGASIAADTTGTSGNNSNLRMNSNKVVTSHKIVSGLITFDDSSGGYSSAVTLSSIADVAAVVEYLQNNDLGGLGKTVTFTTTTISSVVHTFVFTQGTSDGSDDTLDTLIDLKSVTVAGLTSSSSITTNNWVLLSKTPTIITGTSSSETLNGTANDDIISGLAGNDIITGSVGDDTLSGAAGADSMTGGFGSDTFDLTGSDATIDTITDWSAGDSFLGELASGGQLNVTITDATVFTATVIAGTNGKVSVTGGAGADSITGGIGIDTLIGGIANDTLDGGLGNDVLTGGAGNDTYYVSSTSETLTEIANEGTDTIVSPIDWTLATNFENLTLIGTAINATGNSVNNVFVGNDSNNVFIGGGGTDDYAGGLGNDTYTISNGSDTITENTGEGTDAVSSAFTYSLPLEVENLTLTGSTAIDGTGNISDNSITGNTNNNSLSGGTGLDTLNGGDGNDTLTGGTFADSLTGGLGTDVFILAKGDTNLTIGGTGKAGTIVGYDSISDFAMANGSVNSEKLDLAGTTSAVLATTLSNETSTLRLNTNAVVDSHSITNGKITFDDASTFSSAVSLTSISDVAAVVQYLQLSDIGTTGSTVAFTATISSVTHTYVYSQGNSTGSDNTLDTLIDLVGVTATSLNLTNATTSGLVWIA